MLACVFAVAVTLLIIKIILCAMKGLRRRAEDDEFGAEYLQAKEDLDDYCAALTERFVNSPLTYEILEAIGDGSDRKPEEIIIKEDGVSGRVDGILRTYDFLAKRVPKLSKKRFAYRCRQNVFGKEKVCDVGVGVSEQEILAKVFNGILGEEYSIAAENNGTVVVMRLKPTNKF